MGMLDIVGVAHWLQVLALAVDFRGLAHVLIAPDPGAGQSELG